MKNKGKFTPALLEANAEKIEQLTYSKPLTPEELEATTQAFIQKALVIQHEQDELDGIKEEYNGRLKPMKKESLEMLQVLKTKQKTVTETVYMVIDEDDGLMITYSKDGDVITSRKLLPAEKQHRLHIASNS